MDNNRKLWFGIDGIDCTGKTSIINALRSNPDITSRHETIIFDEFTTAAPGDALRTIISEHRFLSIASTPSSRWADTGLLLSDWCYKLESFNNSSAGAAISDRSSLSIIGYQAVRLHRQYPAIDIESAAKDIRYMTTLVQHSMRDMKFFDVLLVSNTKALQKRLSARNEAPLNDHDLNEIFLYQKTMLEARPSLVIDTSELSLSEALNKISSAYSTELSRFE